MRSATNFPGVAEPPSRMISNMRASVDEFFFTGGWSFFGGKITRAPNNKQQERSSAAPLHQQSSKLRSACTIQTGGGTHLT